MARRKAIKKDLFTYAANLVPTVVYVAVNKTTGKRQSVFGFRFAFASTMRNQT